MGFFDIIRAMAALAATLGLVGLAAWAGRRFGPDALARLQAGSVLSPRVRRLQVVESLMLDPQRRLLLISLDGQERLLLLGEGKLLSMETSQ